MEMASLIWLVNQAKACNPGAVSSLMDVAIGRKARKLTCGDVVLRKPIQQYS
jgi:hypothetical protein